MIYSSEPEISGLCSKRYGDLQVTTKMAHEGGHRNFTILLASPSPPPHLRWIGNCVPSRNPGSTPAFTPSDFVTVSVKLTGGTFDLFHCARQRNAIRKGSSAPTITTLHWWAAPLIFSRALWWADLVARQPNAIRNGSSTPTVTTLHWWAAPLIFLTETVMGWIGCIPICAST